LVEALPEQRVEQWVVEDQFEILEPDSELGVVAKLVVLVDGELDRLRHRPDGGRRGSNEKGQHEQDDDLMLGQAVPYHARH
jgi:hypothetical protein